MVGKVTGMDFADFEACVREAKRNCPVSMIMNILITTEAILNN
jgi:osmotically inducible protein OsmC